MNTDRIPCTGQIATNTAEIDMPDISIVTPSYNMLDQLQRCCASVADQRGAACEHIVMDGGSTDGTPEWLRDNPSVAGTSQRDNGMYDAVNKGFRVARGELIAHLNCDEQYLPGTLQYVVEYFRTHSEVDVLFGNVLTVKPTGDLIAYRKCYNPIEPVILSSPLHVFTAATFFRRRIIDKGFIYDDSYKDIGDVDFVLRLSRAGFRFAHVNKFLATFTITGHNRSGHISTIPAEVKRLRQQSPWWVRQFRPIWRAVGLGMKFRAGAYREKLPIRYAIYADAQEPARTEFEAHTASFRWRF